MNSLQSFYTWCDKNQGKSIQIQKREGHDLDVIIMELQKATLGQLDPYHEDSYLTDQALYLYGSGVIDAQIPLVQIEIPQSLPQNIYVIPFTDSLSIQEEGERLIVHTERAQYLLNPLN